MLVAFSPLLFNFRVGIENCVVPEYYLAFIRPIENVW